MNPIGVVLRDAERWGCDITRHGRAWTITLLGEHVATIRHDTTNAETRAAHQLIADATGHRINNATGKRVRARQRLHVEADRAESSALTETLEAQIQHQTNLDAARRRAEANWRNEMFYRNLMRTG